MRLPGAFLPVKEGPVAILREELLSPSVGPEVSLGSYSLHSTRCLLLPGRAAAQEEKVAAVLAAAATAVGLLQTQTTRQPVRIPVASQGPVHPLGKLPPPPALLSSRPEVHLKVRKMREHLPPGDQGWTLSLLTSTLTDLRYLVELFNI